MTCFINKSRMPGYKYDQVRDEFSAEDPTFHAIRRDTSVRHKIQSLKFEEGERIFFAISTIKDEFLGVV